jgi:hypothetical protein
MNTTMATAFEPVHERVQTSTADVRDYQIPADFPSEKAVSMNTTMATAFEPVQTSTADVRDYQIPDDFSTEKAVSMNTPMARASTFEPVQTSTVDVRDHQIPADFSSEKAVSMNTTMASTFEAVQTSTVDVRGYQIPADFSSENAVPMNTTMATAFEPVQTSTVDVGDYQIPAVPAKSLANSTMERKNNPLRGSERIRQETENENTLQTQSAVSDKSIQLETPQTDAKPKVENPKPSASSVAKQTVVEKPVRTGNTDSKEATDMLRRPVPPPSEVNEAPRAALPNGDVVTKAANPPVTKEEQPQKEMEKRQIDQRKPSSRTNNTEISEGPHLPPPVAQPPLSKLSDAEDKRKPENEIVSAGKESQRVEETVQQQSQSDQRRRGIDGEANLTSDETNPEESVALGGLGAENKKLLEELAKAKEQISELQRRTSLNEQQSDSTREQLLINFHEKEARLLQATTEEHQQELFRMEQKMQSEIHSITEQLARDRKQFVQQQENYKVTIDQSQSRAEQAENELKKYQKKQENQLTQSQQREERSIRMAEDKVAQTMAMLDERDEQVSNLKKLMRDLESKMNENQEGVEEAEDEVEELQTENESLQELIDTLELECKGLKAHVAELETDGEKFGGMQVSLCLDNAANRTIEEALTNLVNSQRWS